MKYIAIKKLFLVTACLICVSAVTGVSAQSNDNRGFEFSGSYGYTHRFGDKVELPNVPNGWTAGTAYRANKRFSIFIEGGQDYARQNLFVPTKQIRTTILGGVRIPLLTRSRIIPFAQVGVGFVRFKNTCSNCSGNVYLLRNAAFSAGGGVDVALNTRKTLAWRTTAEYRRIEGGANAFRLSSGVVINY